MSNRLRTKVQAVAVPKAIVRAQIAGEVINACGGSRVEVEIGQTGVARNLLDKVVVYALDSDGFECDKIEFNFTGDTSGEVHLDLDNGRRSAIEAIPVAVTVALCLQKSPREQFMLDIELVLAVLIGIPQRLAAHVTNEVCPAPFCKRAMRSVQSPRVRPCCSSQAKTQKKGGRSRPLSCI